MLLEIQSHILSINSIHFLTQWRGILLLQIWLAVSKKKESPSPLKVAMNGLSWIYLIKDRVDNHHKNTHRVCISLLNDKWLKGQAENKLSWWTIIPIFKIKLASCYWLVNCLDTKPWNVDSYELAFWRQEILSESRSDVCLQGWLFTSHYTCDSNVCFYFWCPK